MRGRLNRPLLVNRSGLSPTGRASTLAHSHRHQRRDLAARAAGPSRAQRVIQTGCADTALQRIQSPNYGSRGNEVQAIACLRGCRLRIPSPRLSRGDSGDPARMGSGDRATSGQRRVSCDLVIVHEEACSSVHSCGFEKKPHPAVARGAGRGIDLVPRGSARDTEGGGAERLTLSALSAPSPLR